MNKKHYNNVIDWTLKHDQAAQTEDSLATARAIFKNMGVALPNGDMQEVYDTIKTNKYMGWRSCTMQKAQQAADKGTAAIGISKDRVVVLSATDEEEPVTATASVVTLSESTSAYAVAGLEYYAYNLASTIINCSNSYLTVAEMTPNALYIYDFLTECGWTKNAVCGMLGNMQTESTINPGIWQNLDANNMNVGFGLVQWTPARKYIDWANNNGLDYLNIDSQLYRILYEVERGEQWISTQRYPLSFKNFTKSNETPSYLTAAFMYNYERPGSYSTLSTRQAQANYWYNLFV